MSQSPLLSRPTAPVRGGTHPRAHGGSETLREKPRGPCLHPIFTVLVAGNIADDLAIGSMEYAVEHFATCS